MAVRETLTAGWHGKRVIISYILDWIVIVGMASVGAAINSITPYRRPFALVDLSIAFPYVKDELISVPALGAIALAGPAIIILLVCLFLVPAPTASRQAGSRGLQWRRKIWEWNAGWLGLALSLAMAFLATQGLKLLFGKPRPHLLAVCNPDLNNISRITTGSVATAFSPEWVLVTSEICRQDDKHLLNDAFKSFPSGHASFGWSGLLYLSLYLCSKFAIAIPFLPPTPTSRGNSHIGGEKIQGYALPRYSNAASVAEAEDHHESCIIDLRNYGAAPPTWTLILVIVPMFVALYICSTRYAQFYHFGCDLLGGSAIGILSAYASFRLYHLPISRGAGWAWGPRSKERAFGIRIGTPGYVWHEGWDLAHQRQRGSDVQDLVPQERHREMEYTACGEGGRSMDV